MTSPRTPPFVCIVSPKTDKATVAAAFMQTTLTQAGFAVTALQDAAEAKQALLDQFHYVVIVVDEIQPDDDGDAFLPWVNALPNAPAIFFVSTAATDEPRGLRYDLASKGYSMDVIFRSIPSANELAYMVRRVVAYFDREEVQTLYKEVK